MISRWIAFLDARIPFLSVRNACWFLVIGAICALVYLGGFSLFWNYFHWSNSRAVTVSYFLSVLVHFFLNRHITFRGSEQTVLHHLKKYVVMILINYAVSLSVVHVATQTFLFYPPFAVCLAIVATTITGFSLAQWWVFK